MKRIPSSMWTCTFTAIFGLATTAPNRTKADEQITIESIKAVWSSRTTKVHSVMIEWDRDTFIPAGGLSDVQSFIQARRLREAKATGKGPASLVTNVPALDYTVSTKSSLTVANERIRYSYSSPQWSQQSNDFKVFSYVSVFVNGKSKALHRDGSTLASHPEAIVRDADSHPDIFDGPLRAITLTLFPTDPKRQPYMIDSFNIVPNKSQINSTLVELARSVGDSRETIWVDAARDFVPVRVSHSTNGKQTFEIAVRTMTNDVCKWAPSSWVVKEYKRDGSLMKSIECKVTQLSVNSSLPESVFDLTLPVGTVVTQPKVDGATYGIVADDGTMRPLSAHDMSRPYEELVHRPTTRRWRWWIVGALVGLLASCFCSYRFRNWWRIRLTLDRGVSSPEADSKEKL